MKAIHGVSLCFIIALSACIKESLPPVPDFSFSPGEGNRYNIFYFDASSSYDPDNASYSLKFRWDFNGDGNFDTDLSENMRSAYKYQDVDCFNVVLEVTDPEGSVAKMTKELCVNDNNSTPFAIFALLPPLASLGTEVIFDATKSFDWEEPAEYLMARWDINGDKVWDTEFSSNKVFQHLYSQPGYYTVIMEIIDSEGASAISEKVLEVANTYNEFNYLTDHRDGHVYGVVKIGDQWIMAQNLVFGTYIDNLFTPRNNGLCEVFAYSNIEENLSKYGGLYLWDEILNYSDREKGKGFCPSGWHLPSDDEWKQLERDMGMKPEEIDTTGWERGESFGSTLRKQGLSGFEAGFYGFRYPYRVFSNIGTEARFWTSSMEEDGSVWVRGLSSWTSGVFRGRVRNNYAYSVRCFKN